MIPDWLQAKNSRNVARWRWRWHLQGGALWAARDMRDLRNAEDLHRWRVLEFKRRHLNKKVRKVVNLAAWRIDCARRRANRLQATA